MEELTLRPSLFLKKEQKLPIKEYYSIFSHRKTPILKPYNKKSRKPNFLLTDYIIPPIMPGSIAGPAGACGSGLFATTASV
ncbi:hypothetical protein ACXM1Q_008145, partial [Streptococcus sp. 10F2]